MRTPIVRYDRESDMALLRPALVNVLRLAGWLALAVLLAPVVLVWLLASDGRGRRRRR